jgi:hypothetical protein
MAKTNASHLKYWKRMVYVFSTTENASNMFCEHPSMFCFQWDIKCNVFYFGMALNGSTCTLQINNILPTQDMFCNGQKPVITLIFFSFPRNYYIRTHPAILTFTLRLWRTCWIWSKDPVRSWDLFNMASLSWIFDSFFERKDKLKQKSTLLTFHKLVKLNIMPLNSAKVSIQSVRLQYKIFELQDFTLMEIIKHGHKIHHMDLKICSYGSLR